MMVVCSVTEMLLSRFLTWNDGGLIVSGNDNGLLLTRDVAVAVP